MAKMTDTGNREIGRTKTLHEDVLLYGLRERMTDEQEAMVESILSNKVTFVNAAAGSGKSTIAVAMAKYLWESEGKKMTYVFSPVEERSMGFRPGTQEEKEVEYLQPLFDALVEVGEQQPKLLMESEDNVEGLKQGKAWIDAKSHIFARGINLKGRTIIADEAQNYTRGDLKKLLSRIHDDCTVIVIGHSGQIDLPKSSTSGFIPYLEHFESEDYVGVCELTKNFRGVISTKADELRW